MRSITAVSVLSLLTIAVFGVTIVHDMPVTPDEANAHAREYLGDPGNTYTWLCPTEYGTYTSEVLEMHADPDIRTDVIRQPTVYVRAPVLLIDSNDPYVLQVADHIQSHTEGCSDYTKIRAALCFVQTGLKYVSDPDLYGCAEYWSTPSETLFYHGGDCEDTAVLFVSIVEAMGYDAVLLDYTGHEAAGVYVDDQSQDYLYCETASDMILLPGQWEPEGEPEIYVPGEFSSVKGSVNSAVAAYRDIIRRVTGA